MNVIDFPISIFDVVICQLLYFIVVLLLIGKMLIDISKGIIMMIRYFEFAVNNGRQKLWSQSKPLEKRIDLGFTKMIPSTTTSVRYHQRHYKCNIAHNLCSLTRNST